MDRGLILKASEVISKVSETSSTNEKIAMLESHKGSELDDLLQKIFFYTYDSKKVYKIGKARLRGVVALNETFIVPRFDNIFELLDCLDSRKGVDNELVSDVREFIMNEPLCEVRELYYNMIMKDLRAGVTATTANKVWPDLIPQFKLQLARKYEDRADKIEGEEIVITQKLDGIRCAIVIDEEGKMEALTRQNRRIDGLQEILTSLKKDSNLLNNIVLDGELVYSAEEELDSAAKYRKTVEVVNSDMKDKKNIKYHIFDMAGLEAFNKGESTEIQYNRRRDILESSISNTDSIELVPVLYQGEDHTKIVELLDEAIANEQEGVMINLTSGYYDCKRSNNLLKVKQMHTVDLRVIGLQEGEGKYKGSLGAILVDYKGYELGVGSGFSDKERELYWGNPELIIDKIVEVQYFEESSNNQGGLSLRFPIFKEVREDKTEVSYN